MGTEIERRFLIDQRKLPDLFHALTITKGKFNMLQGYLTDDPKSVIRIRTVLEPAIARAAYLTLKGETANGSRTEIETKLAELDAALEMLDKFHRGRILRKTRYVVEFDGLDWEIDFFHDYHDGLIIAEVELDQIDQQITLPPWVGKEITDDFEYSNARLAFSNIK